MADPAPTAPTAPVRAGAGTLRPDGGVSLPHAWTGEGVVAETGGTGAHVLHLAVALCVLNDVYREADRLGLHVAGVQVAAEGGFTEDWTSTGIRYDVRVEGPSADETEALLEVVDWVAEIPRALRAGVEVLREARP